MLCGGPWVDTSSHGEYGDAMHLATRRPFSSCQAVILVRTSHSATQTLYTSPA